VSVFVDGEDARFLPPDTNLANAKVVELLPAVSGG
jgi:molybdopterin converting factor small subunit